MIQGQGCGEMFAQMLRAYVGAANPDSQRQAAQSWDTWAHTDWARSAAVWECEPR